MLLFIPCRLLPLEHRRIHDISKYPEYRPHGRPRSLRHLALEILGLEIQHGEHSSVEDARAAMLLHKAAELRRVTAVGAAGAQTVDI